MMEYEKDLHDAERNRQKNEATLTALKKQRPKNLDDQFHELHYEVFEEVDCLKCANCCKTTSPLFLEPDIERLARVLKMKVSDFIQTYLRKDEEGDFVLQSAPCPFLAADNYCLVYENRPKACREYPHTNRKRMYQILDLTFKNTLVCPAVSRIVSKLERL